IVAIGTSLVFERRTFCRYLCPVGGFIGLYSQVAAVELRVKDPAICAGHKEKTCYTGSDAGYGCPWLLFPGGLTNNTYCGLCTECLKTCNRDNIAIFLRRPGADLLRTTNRKLDEAYKGLIMLACAFIYSAVLIGPWGALKQTAAAVGTPGWFAYAAAFLTLNLAVFPGLFWLAVRAGSVRHSSNQPIARLFADYAIVLVPLGLAAWAAFSLSFVLINLSYAWSALSDPLGWGWNLFGTAGLAWMPYASGLVPYLQVAVLLIGLSAAIGLALRAARQHGQPSRAALPVVLFCIAAALGLLALYLA
ncbi:MAG: 4Fe-4S binding protein, partial [Anaerolineae bacterium]